MVKAMFVVNKCTYNIPLICDGCYRTYNITDSPRDSMYEITFGNGSTLDLCSECASQLADKLCDVLGKTRVDTDSKSCEEC